MKASPDGRPCAHRLVSENPLLPTMPPRQPVPGQQLHLLVEHHMHTVRPNVSRRLAQKAEDVFDGGCVGQASQADTVSPGPSCQWEGDGQQWSSQGGKEWAGGVAVQDLEVKEAAG